MGKKIIVVLLVGLALASIRFAEAQQPKKIPRIGYLSSSESGFGFKWFRQGLRDLGYVEGKDILVEYRTAEARRERIPGLVNELIQLKVDVLVSSSQPVIRSFKQATKTIPIVMVANFDPVAIGIVNSLARPGGNITGLATLQRELAVNGWNCLVR